MQLVSLKFSWVLIAVLALCCQQGGALYIYSCEGGVLKPRCPYGQAMRIQSAMFGKKPGSHLRCGEPARVRRACETDITEYVKYKCQNQAFCEIHVDLATFNLDTFCPEFMKYAEVNFECLPPMAMHNYNSCVQKCIPGSPASPTMGAGGMGNAVVPGPQASAPNTQPGVIYSHSGGTPIHNNPGYGGAHPVQAPTSSSSNGHPGVIYNHMGGGGQRGGGVGGGVRGGGGGRGRIHAPSPASIKVAPPVQAHIPPPPPPSSPSSSGSQPGVIYNRNGGMPVHRPPTPASSGGAGPRTFQRHKGFGPPRMRPQPSPVEPPQVEPQQVEIPPPPPPPIRPADLHPMISQADFTLYNPQSSQPKPSPTSRGHGAPRQAMIANVGQMLGAMRSGRAG
ncbi:hypothetical protein ACOMHN_001286 [Nucella lapillus]